ncbi:rab GTPase-binding effector protein 1-like [Artemia franciscana]|uniref:FYVE-type domain-containing protein n=1 Tax=Artemia franciscana TaxID=6661 RepID=A0AA88I4V6_ARTSF|nr:hypothetical protein QYM36_002447 [Artemia franciscana]
MDESENMEDKSEHTSSEVECIIDHELNNDETSFPGNKDSLMTNPTDNCEKSISGASLTDDRRSVIEEIMNGIINECTTHLSSNGVSQDAVPDRPPRNREMSPAPPLPPRACALHLNQIQKLLSELEEARQINAIAQLTWSDEIQRVERRYKEELETIQALLEENVQAAGSAAKLEAESEIRRLKGIVNRLELELSEYRAADKDTNVFSTMKTFARKVGNLTPNMLSATSLTNSFLSLDDSIDKEQLSASCLKKVESDDELSLVASLEEEVKHLKDKIRVQDQQLQHYESQHVAVGDEVGTNIADLELYTGMLNTQKAILQEENVKLRSQYEEAQKALELERQQHLKLQQAWKKACIQYATQQKSRLREVRQLKLLFTDVVTNEEEENVSVTSWDQEQQFLKGSKPCLKTSKMESLSVTSGESASTISSEVFSTPGVQYQAELSSETSSNSCGSQSDDSAIALATEQWDSLQDELKSVYKMTLQTCNRLSTLKDQCAKLEEQQISLTSRSSKAESESDRIQKELSSAMQLFRDNEEKWLAGSRESEKIVCSLSSKYNDLFKKYEVLQKELASTKKTVHQHLRELKFDRCSVSREMARLQEENDRLIGKHSQTSRELCNEKINLPSDVTELQEELLKMRDELIAAKIARECTEEKLSSEIQYYKDSAESETSSREQREETLTAEVDNLREQLGIACSYQSQWEEEVKRSESLKLTLKNLKDQVSRLMSDLKDVEGDKEEKDKEIAVLKNRIASLQTDLQTSEEVQRDFVKLSQTLQMQLENLRLSEKEVRWQHEDDAVDCPTCNTGFSMMKKKHRCRHCGHIFCGDCLKYTVYSGPNRRSAKVCNVCYYLLVPDSTPFFGQN